MKYTILNEDGSYWQSIEDMHSTEDWAVAFTFWTSKKMAEECLKYHQKKYKEDGGYKKSKVIAL